VSDTSPNMTLADFLFSWVRGHSSPPQVSSLFFFFSLFSPPLFVVTPPLLRCL
jgi:hypothetical protein